MVGLANGGLVVFNVNFNRWREEIQSGKLKQEQQSSMDQDYQEQHTTPSSPLLANTTAKTEEQEAESQEQQPAPPEFATNATP